MSCVQGPGRGFGGQGHPPTPPSSGMSKDQRRNAKAMAKLDKQVEAEKPRVYKPLSEEERLEAARWATISSLARFALNASCLNLCDLSLLSVRAACGCRGSHYDA